MYARLEPSHMDAREVQIYALEGICESIVRSAGEEMASGQVV